MFFKNRVYSRWLGPVVGVCAGLEYTFDHAISGKPHEFVLNLCLSTSVGFAAGLLIMLVDPPAAAKYGHARKRARPTLPGNVLCALSFLFFFMPVFNVVLAALALACNWKVGGWPRRLSCLGLALAVACTCGFVPLSMFYNPGQW